MTARPDFPLWSLNSGEPMKVLYLSKEIEQGEERFDPGCLADQVDKVIPYTPPFQPDDFKAIIEQQDNLFIIAARDPQLSSSPDDNFFPVELANKGINPGNVGFVDLNHIFLASANHESVINRLQIHIGLTFIKLAHTRENPRIGNSPIRRIFIVGSPPEGFTSELTAAGIELTGIWTDNSIKVDGEPTGLSGTPGNYLVRLEGNQGEVVSEVGAMAVFTDQLSADQKKSLSTGFNFSLKNGEVHLLPNQLRLSQGIKVVDAAPPVASLTKFYLELLNQNQVPHYIEDPLIDHSKCGLCGTCVKTCMFHASTIEDTGEAERSKIFPELCVACGNCVTACPTQARDLPSYSYDYFSSVWENLQTFKGGADGLKILVIYCESNGHDAIKHLADNQIPVPSSCLFFRIRCGARVDTQFIPDSFRAGFDGVAVVVCSRDECGNIVGSLDLERRLNLYRKVMQSVHIETGRMRILPVASDQLESVSTSLQQFADFLVNLKQDKKLINTLLQ